MKAEFLVTPQIFRWGPALFPSISTDNKKSRPFTNHCRLLLLASLPLPIKKLRSRNFRYEQSHRIFFKITTEKLLALPTWRLECFCTHQYLLLPCLRASGGIIPELFQKYVFCCLNRACGYPHHAFCYYRAQCSRITFQKANYLVCYNYHFFQSHQYKHNRFG